MGSSPHSVMRVFVCFSRKYFVCVLCECAKWSTGVHYVPVSARLGRRPPARRARRTHRLYGVRLSMRGGARGAARAAGARASHNRGLYSPDPLRRL